MNQVIIFLFLLILVIYREFFLSFLIDIKLVFCCKNIDEVYDSVGVSLQILKGFFVIFFIGKMIW